MKEQIIFKFPEKSFYFEEDFCIGDNNLEAYKIIKNWPNWDFKLINIFGPKKSGKSHLTKIFSDITNSEIFHANKIEKEDLELIIKSKILIIENVELFKDELLFHTILNDFINKKKFVFFTSSKFIGKIKFVLKDLNSRLNSFVGISIDNPSDKLFAQILIKMLSDKQVNLSEKEISYICNKIERTYESLASFVNILDELSLIYKKKITLKIINEAIVKQLKLFI
jgi:chromosomal replication initiation ATPase DnaA